MVIRKSFYFVLGGLFLLLALQRESSQAAPIATAAESLRTEFTYQGRLLEDDIPVSDACDFRFSLWDAVSGGSQIGATYTASSLSVNNGLFTATVDFGDGIFNGDARWLAVSVRCPAGSGTYTAMGPRQALTATPYALALPGLWTEPNADSPNLIGGYSGNIVSNGVVGATISGGGASSAVNRVTDDYGTVSGGLLNQAGDDAGNTSDIPYATVGGGYFNEATGLAALVGGGSSNSATWSYATVAGGVANNATAFGTTVGGGNDNDATASAATIAGGQYNVASAFYAAIGGGSENTASAVYATIAGGAVNTASGEAVAIGGGDHNVASGEYAVVGGGLYNTANGNRATVSGGSLNQASSEAATVSGGVVNVASGEFAAVPGGRNNSAEGNFSFAAGRRAKALHPGSFVWADSQDYDFSTFANNAFKVRATGGVRIVVGIDETAPGPETMPTWQCTFSDGSSWTCSSSRALKENLDVVNGRRILELLAEVPVYRWNAKGQDPAVTHMGPTSEDFYAAFGLGDDERAIATIDLDGVALAAIQGLNGVTQEQATQIEAQEAQIEALQSQIVDLQTRLATLEQAVGRDGATLRQLPPDLSGSAPLLFGGLLGVALALHGRRRNGDER